jgi:hypothetical protein
MDPMEPIAGISLEAYADLCALMKDTGTDTDRQAGIAAQHGHDRASWEAAKTGWTDRMASPATAGAVTTAFMPLYQAALARTGPAKTATFEEYVRMSAMVQMGVPFETMYAEHGITGADWSQISTAWVDRLTHDSALASRFGDAVAAERAKLGAEQAQG